jgi:hypothetical protein
VRRAPLEGLLVLWGSMSCVRDIFILNEIWVHFACLKYSTCRLVLVLALNYKQHILSLAEVRKHVTFAELYVRCVYLNLFGWRGAQCL